MPHRHNRSVPALAVIPLLALTSAVMAGDFNVTDIGVFGLNDETAPASGRVINNSGQVAATSFYGRDFYDAVRYTPGVGLENLDPVGLEDSISMSINDAGQVFGRRLDLVTRQGNIDLWRYTDGVGHESLTSDAAILSTFDTRIFAMNNNGVVVGNYNSAAPGDLPTLTPIRAGATGGFIDLTTIDPALTDGSIAPTALNEAGVFSAQQSFPGGIIDGVRYSDSLGLLDIGSLGGVEPNPITNPTDINELNQICGISRVPTPDASVVDHAFIYSDQTGMVDIHTIPSAQGSSAFFINDSGVVAGTLERSEPLLDEVRISYSAFIYDNANGMTELGDFSTIIPAGMTVDGVRVCGLTSNGHVAGHVRARFDITDSSEPVTVVPWFWSPSSGLVNLEAAVDPVFTQDYEFGECAGINDSDQIVIEAEYQVFTPATRRVLILEPAAPACPCDLDGVAGVDVFDLLAYLDLWFAADQAAELTGDSTVDVFDLLAYLDCWFGASAGGPCP